MILELSQSHYDDVLDTWEKSVAATHHFLKPQEIKFYKTAISKYGLPPLKLFGIYDKSILSGFIGLSETKVEMLFVHPDYIGTGIGKKLMSFAMQNPKIKFIDVNEENPHAFAVYQHWGFTVISRDELDDSGKPHPILHLSR